VVPLWVTHPLAHGSPVTWETPPRSAHAGLLAAAAELVVEPESLHAEDTLIELAPPPVPELEMVDPDCETELLCDTPVADPGSLSAADVALADPKDWLPSGESISPPDVSTDPSTDDTCSICIIDVARGSVSCTSLNVTPRIVPLTVTADPAPALPWA
jgi:hypothetical protein